MLPTGAIRHNVLVETSELAELTGIPYFTTSMTKSAMDETSPRYGGIYGGAFTKPDVKKVVEGSDCVLWIGNYPSDLNTGEFTDNVAEDVIIDFERFWVSIGKERFLVAMKHVLVKLVEEVKKSPEIMNALNKKAIDCNPFGETPKKQNFLIQEWFWPVS
jgi:pyruvate decarboxylase